jgi:hypothetical protein
MPEFNEQCVMSELFLVALIKNCSVYQRAVSSHVSERGDSYSSGILKAVSEVKFYEC